MSLRKIEARATSLHTVPPVPALDAVNNWRGMLNTFPPLAENVTLGSERANALFEYIHQARLARASGIAVPSLEHTFIKRALDDPRINPRPEGQQTALDAATHYFGRVEHILLLTHLRVIDAVAFEHFAQIVSRNPLFTDGNWRSHALLSLNRAIELYKPSSGRSFVGYAAQRIQADLYRYFYRRIFGPAVPFAYIGKVLAYKRIEQDMQARGVAITTDALLREYAIDHLQHTKTEVTEDAIGEYIASNGETLRRQIARVQQLIPLIPTDANTVDAEEFSVTTTTILKTRTHLAEEFEHPEEILPLIERLPDRLHTLFMLRAVEGLEFTDIVAEQGEALHVHSVSQAAMLYRRAVEALQGKHPGILMDSFDEYLLTTSQLPATESHLLSQRIQDADVSHPLALTILKRLYFNGESLAELAAEYTYTRENIRVIASRAIALLQGKDPMETRRDQAAKRRQRTQLVAN